MAEAKPEHPSFEYLRKLAENRLQEIRRTDPEAKLATALLHVAREYGWRALKAQIEGHRAKKIANPVMRFLAVTDIGRSIAFFRDVLGFEVITRKAGLRQSWDPHASGSERKDFRRVTRDSKLRCRLDRPSCFCRPTMLWQRSALRAHGGSPSEIENQDADVRNP